MIISLISDLEMILFFDSPTLGNVSVCPFSILVISVCWLSFGVSVRLTFRLDAVPDLNLVLSLVVPSNYFNIDRTTDWFEHDSCVLFFDVFDPDPRPTFETGNE